MISLSSPFIQNSVNAGVYVRDPSVKLSIAPTMQISLNKIWLAASTTFAPASFGQVFNNLTSNYQNIPTYWVRSTVSSGGTLNVAITSSAPTHALVTSEIASLTINLPGAAFSGQLVRIESANANPA